MQERIEMTKREELLKKHPFEIWKGSDNLWHTYLPDEEKGRMHKKRKNRKDLEDVVVDYWKREEEDPTVKDVFYKWINSKLELKEISKATYDRYERDFKKFFIQTSDFGKRRVKEITDDDIERFVKKSIADNELTVKSFANLRTLIYGIFKKCRKMIDFSISQLMQDIEISSKSFRKVIKEDDEEVFTEEEYPKVLSYLLDHIDIINLGILLMFSTGIRIGELCTLKREDISDCSVKIRRTETIYKNENGEMVYEVKEYPKTDAGVREAAIPASDHWIIRKLISMNPFGEFLFQNDGERIRSYVFRNRLGTICNKTGIVRKSPHKIRKTYGTILLDNNVDKRLVIEQMGHADVATTEKSYHRNRRNINRKSEILDKIDELRII